MNNDRIVSFSNRYAIVASETETVLMVVEGPFILPEGTRITLWREVWAQVSSTVFDPSRKAPLTLKAYVQNCDHKLADGSPAWQKGLSFYGHTHTESYCRICSCRDPSEPRKELLEVREEDTEKLEKAVEKAADDYDNLLGGG